MSRIVVGLVVGVVVVIGVVGLGVRMMRVAPQILVDEPASEADAKATVSGNFGTTGISSAPVALEGPGATNASQAAAAQSPFTAAAPFEEAKASTRADHTIRSLAERLAPTWPADAPALNDPPRWEAAADPPPPESQFAVAADLRIAMPHWDSKLISGRTIIWPTLAALNGPYALVPPTWQQWPFAFEGDDDSVTIKETPQAAVPVIDLRTGQTAGEFDWRVPSWMYPALSPDGTRLLGPYHVPVARIRGVRRTIPDQINEALRSLYVWQRDSQDPPRAIPIKGFVSWYAFVGKEMAAILVEGPQRQLQFWNVATGEQQAAVDVPYDWYKAAQFQYTDVHDEKQVVMKNLAAVSPGGRYVAIGGRAGVTMVAVAEARVLGQLDVELVNTFEPVHYFGMAFSSAGDELIVAYRARLPQDREATRIVVWSVADGRRRMQRDLPVMYDVQGPLWLSPDHKAVIFGARYTPNHLRPPRFVDLDKGKPEDWVDVPLLPRTVDGPELLVSLVTPGTADTAVRSVDRTSFDASIAERVRLDQHGTEKPSDPPDLPIDRSTVQVVQLAPPTTWTPFPELPQAPPMNNERIGYSPKRSRWSDRYLGMLAERPLPFDPHKQQRQQYEATWWCVDLEQQKLAHPPLPLYKWPDLGLARIEAFGFSADGARLAVAAPRAPDRIDIWTMDGTCQFGFRPKPRVPVEWIDFAADGRLLVSAGGELSCWELGPEAAKAVYETSNAGYVPPLQLLPGREWLAASRGGAFDVLDVRTGQVHHRLGIVAEGVIGDVAFAPDRKHVAALYVPATRSWHNSAHQVVRDGTHHYPSTLALWDLATGEARQLALEFTDFGLLAWASPEHLVLCAPTSRLFDLRLNSETLAWTPSRMQSSTYDYGYPMSTTPDGRLWVVSSAAARLAQIDPLDWTVATYPSNGGRSATAKYWQPIARSPQEKPFFAEDRAILALDQTPLRVELDVGNRKLGRAHGERILLELRGRGNSIGPGGLVLRIAPRVVPTTERLESQGGKPSEYIPAVNYLWELRDAQERLVWSHTTTGKFQGSSSKYFKGSSSEQATYDFGNKAVELAIVEEILERGAGLAVPVEFPKVLLFGDGQYVPFPQELPWTTAEEAKAGSP